MVVFLRPAACRASTERLTGIAWHPNARPSIHLQQGADAAADSSGTVALGTGCADGSAALWSEGGKLLRKLEGHTERLGRVAFHPMGLHFVSRLPLIRMQGVGLGCALCTLTAHASWPAVLWRAMHDVYACLLPTLCQHTHSLVCVRPLPRRRLPVTT